MTLADFARSIGISPATARQWKKRGKIVERDGHFELIAEAQREWVGLPGRDASVTVGDLITDGSGATSKVTGVKVDCNGGVVVRAESVTDSAQDSRLCRREDSNGGVGNPESHRESCADKNQLLAVMVRVVSEATSPLKQQIADLGEAAQRLHRRVLDLETEVRFLRTRLGKSDAPVTVGTTSRGPIDPPSSGWGA